MGRLPGAAMSVAAVILLGAGAALVTAPQRLAGPMGFGLDLPFGVLLLILVVAAAEGGAAAGRPIPRVAYALAAVAAGGLAGWNFYHYPPIADGAYFLARYGRDVAERWTPGSPAGPVFAAASVAWAIDRAVRLVPVSRGLGALAVHFGSLLAWTIVGWAAYAAFIDMLVRGPTRDALLGIPLASLLIALPCHGLKSRFEVARAGFGISVAILLLSLASWGLYRA